MTKMLVALYEDLETARKVVSDLVAEDFDREKINLVAYDPDGEYGKFLEENKTVTVGEPGTAEAAGLGAIAGALGGLVVGLAAGVLPGIGPVLVGGTIGSGLIGAGVGAAAGSLVGVLVDLGLPEEKAEVYAEGVRRGGTLVTVTLPQEHVEKTQEILDDHDPIDMDRRSAQWHREGWAGFDPAARPYTRTEVDRDRDLYNMEGDFRQHYQQNYADTDEPYEHYQPGYTYGYDLARDPKYEGQNWTQVRSEAREQWEERDIGDWDAYEEAVLYGWNAKRRLV